MAHDEALPRTAANFVPLTPLSFLARTADLFPARVALIHGRRRQSWGETDARCRALASALERRGVGPGDTVAVLAPNVPELFELHFAVPMAGAVLNAINVRLDPETIAYILDHGGAKLLIADTGFAPSVKAALALLGRDLPVVDIDDSQGPGGERLGEADYEALLAEGDPNAPRSPLADEWAALTLNYTSGTSGRPRGAVYHHRGAYLMALGTVAAWGLPMHPTYLYSVPLFHCNGWGHVWTMTLMAATVVCCRSVTAKAVFDAIAEHGVTHLGGAPVVLGTLVNAPAEERRVLDRPVKVMTAGAPPPPAILGQIEAMGFEVMQVYGLTETYGHVLQCLWREEWEGLPFEDRAEIKSRQGIGLPITEEVRVVDLATRAPVPRDGVSEGEIVVRGNTLMKGYHDDPAATAAIFEGGWLKTGDVAVWFDNGYVQIKDRLKDVIISGGENVSSVEVEAVLYRHPAVAAAAVVARPDPRWGEVPVAYVELKPGATADEAEMIAFCRGHTAGFKTPKAVTFGDLPKTATGKIQKFRLRRDAADTARRDA